MNGPYALEETRARRVKFALVALFLVCGLVLAAAAFQRHWRFTPVNLVVGACVMAVGYGLWRHMRWARLAALGGCFLALLAALTYPALAFTLRPFERFDHDGFMTLLICITALGVAFIAWCGIEYLRAPIAQRQFSRTPNGVAALAAEPPAMIVVSALLWIGLFWLASNFGLQFPQWIRPQPPSSSLQLPGGNIMKAISQTTAGEARDS